MIQIAMKLTRLLSLYFGDHTLCSVIPNLEREDVSMVRFIIRGIWD